MSESKLVVGRECGKCSACCISLTIIDEKLKKDADLACPNLIVKGGCRIYQERPNVCKSWYCGWRFMEGLGPDWRPDRIKVVLRFDEGGGITFQPIGEPVKALTNKKVLKFMGAAMEGGIQLFISVPTKPGFCSAKAYVNDQLASAVQMHDLSELKNAMKKLIEYSSKIKTDPKPRLD